MRIAVFGKTIDAESLDKLSVLVGLFKKYSSVEWLFFREFYERYNEIVEFPIGELFSNYKDIYGKADLFLSLGGDGTFLESLTIVRDSGIPIAGINLGRLGFLTTECVGSDNNWIDKLLKRDYSIEKRTVLNVDSCAGNNIKMGIFPYSLNEITIQRIEPAMLEIHVSINGDEIPVYWADGILVATATGSTAYSLSVGGPVVTPDAKVLIISPISPHNLNVRPLIVPESSCIELSFSGRCEEAQLTLDNRYFKIKKGDKIMVKAANFELNCVTINDNFINALNQKLLWGEDRRNRRL